MFSEVREKSESFEGFFGGRNIFFKTYVAVTQSVSSSFFLNILPSPIGWHHLSKILANRRRQNILKK